MQEFPGFKGHRFPPQIIEHAFWLYFCFSLSLRDVEDLLAERGITVSHETVRFWVIKFAANMPNQSAETARQLMILVLRQGRDFDPWQEMLAIACGGSKRQHAKNPCAQPPKYASS